MTEIEQKCQCDGSGTYFDRRCTIEECAHRGKKSEKGVYDKPIMPCPERACCCKAGAPARAAMKKVIQAQELRIEQAEEYTR